MFTIERTYQEGKSSALDAPGRTGEYLGSGDGTIHGERISGSVHWDQFEKLADAISESNLRGLN